jgi:hypothetical protein
MTLAGANVNNGHGDVPTEASDMPARVAILEDAQFYLHDGLRSICHQTATLKFPAWKMLILTTSWMSAMS